MTNCLFACWLQAGVESYKYDGCIKCDKHVWGPKDKSTTCPLCDGLRYDKEGVPLEQVVHFPLKTRLASLLRDSSQFTDALRYEFERIKGEDDVVAGWCGV
jgi:hypothetical protein